MGPGYYIMAIMGCADGSTACTPVATAPTRYESAADCSAATEDVLTRNMDLDFPTLVAECRSTVAPAGADKPERSPHPVIALASRG